MTPSTARNRRCSTQSCNRFWRRDRRRAVGAGLGLSIVQRIADAYGGEIAVDNRPGGGSAFGLRLARAADEVSQEGSRSSH
ncbi:MAG: hypothetical protein IT537_22125 [Hyphomicrobiales bacterium]|nr:hypothetical protein [Hyphomicrobiales bacterium]